MNSSDEIGGRIREARKAHYDTMVEAARANSSDAVVLIDSVSGKRVGICTGLGLKLD